MTGFLAGAVSASFTGKLADRYGRRAACLAFCVIYSLSCLTLLTNDIAILFLGRVLGGVSTTLMYSVFESWMVTEFNTLFPDAPGSTLSGIFSTMTTLNSVVAIFAGIVAEWVADLSGTEKAPFMTAVGCLIAAFLAISKGWVIFHRTLATVAVLTRCRVRTTARVDLAKCQSWIRKPKALKHRRKAHFDCSSTV
jgi:MFS transporter, MFS domain-containing protein family, molybdate-anion transporter